MLRTNFRATSAAMALLALVVVVFFPTGIPSAAAEPEPTQQIESLKVHIISTMLATRGLGEWGFSALVEANGHWILIDTGHDPDIVLGNAQQMGVDLSQVTDVVLSHFHPDHTGGLMKLRQELLKRDDITSNQLAIRLNNGMSPPPGPLACHASTPCVQSP